MPSNGRRRPAADNVTSVNDAEPTAAVKSPWIIAFGVVFGSSERSPIASG